MCYQKVCTSGTLIAETIVKVITLLISASVILLSRTIFSTLVLEKFIGECERLKHSEIKVGRLAGQGHKKGCMSDVQQEAVLKKFREGKDHCV